MLNRIAKLGVVLVSIAGLAITGHASEKLKVLVVTGGHGFDKQPFFAMFDENAGITFYAASHAARTNATVFERSDLLTYDVVVLYDMPKSITEKQKKNFLSMFGAGIGVVVLHHALVSYQDWPDSERIIGGRYPEEEGKSGAVTEQVGWQHDVDIPVSMVARDHPITKGLKDFTIHDEIYWGFRVGRDVTPLLRTNHPKSGNPLMWTRTEGKSRLVYLQLGHGPTAFKDANYRQLLARSIEWAARRL